MTGHEIIEAALKKASEGNHNNSPIGYMPEEGVAYQHGMAAAYQHALEMIPVQEDTTDYKEMFTRYLYRSYDHAHEVAQLNAHIADLLKLITKLSSGDDTKIVNYLFETQTWPNEVYDALVLKKNSQRETLMKFVK